MEPSHSLSSLVQRRHVSMHIKRLRDVMEQILDSNSLNSSSISILISTNKKTCLVSWIFTRWTLPGDYMTVEWCRCFISSPLWLMSYHDIPKIWNSELSLWVVELRFSEAVWQDDHVCTAQNEPLAIRLCRPRFRFDISTFDWTCSIEYQFKRASIRCKSYHDTATSPKTLLDESDAILVMVYSNITLHVDLSYQVMICGKAGRQFYSLFKITTSLLRSSICSWLGGGYTVTRIEHPGLFLSTWLINLINHFIESISNDFISANQDFVLQALSSAEEDRQASHVRSNVLLKSAMW